MLEFKRTLNNDPNSNTAWQRAHLIRNDLVQYFRWIPAGEFRMGSPLQEMGRDYVLHGQETQHTVTISKGFWLAETPCTQALWQAIMQNNPAHFKNNENNPIERVSWIEVMEFIEKLNKELSSLTAARLPTEAEWEYACRAGTSTAFSFGDTITPDQVNHDGECSHLGASHDKNLNRKKTTPVGSLGQNAWHLFDMHGNVWEWCADAWQYDLGKNAAVDPLIVSKATNYRVARGGSWYDNAKFCRSATRGKMLFDQPSSHVGFRLALRSP